MSVLVGCSLCTAARWLLCLTGFGSVAQAHSVGLSLYYCFIYSIGFHCILVINLVPVFGFLVNVVSFYGVHCTAFLVMCSISIISLIFPIKCWFSSKCVANFD